MIQIAPRLGFLVLLLRGSLKEEILVAHHLYSVSAKSEMSLSRESFTKPLTLPSNASEAR